jgi:hypothetical protein
MIKEIPMYTVICDRCGADHNADADWSAWNDKDYAVDCAKEDLWEEIDGKHYCPDCYFWDDEDDETPTIKPPKEDKQL